MTAVLTCPLVCNLIQDYKIQSTRLSGNIWAPVIRHLNLQWIQIDPSWEPYLEDCQANPNLGRIYFKNNCWVEQRIIESFLFDNRDRLKCFRSDWKVFLGSKLKRLVWDSFERL